MNLEEAPTAADVRKANQRRISPAAMLVGDQQFHEFPHSRSRPSKEIDLAAPYLPFLHNLHRTGGEQDTVEVRPSQPIRRIDHRRPHRPVRKNLLPAASFEDRFNPLEERRRQLGEEIAPLEAELALLKVESLNADHILSQTSDLSAKWPRLSRGEAQGGRGHHPRSGDRKG